MTTNELGLFLRSRRESVTPAAVGLPTGPRRRTPGLRRSELATLAGVSVEYLTRLEQGRDRRPSPGVLAALAEALRLTPSERVHFHRLCKSADGFACRAAPVPPSRTVRPTVRALLDRLDPAPAVLLNPLSELLAWTQGYERLAGPLGLLDPHPDGPPNLARFVFADPRARAVYPDWEHVADEQVAALKQGPFRADPHIVALVDELTVTAGPAFTNRLARLPGLPCPTGITRISHPGVRPDAGPLRLAYETLDLPAEDAQRLLVHLPADPATAAALDRLAGLRPGGLRAVGS